MPNELLTLAKAVLARSTISRDSAWDNRGTTPKGLSQAAAYRGTPEIPIKQSEDPTVPLSQALGPGTVGHSETSGTARGTVVGQPYVSVLAALRSKCPELVEPERWEQAVRDAEVFVPKWSEQAQTLGWTVQELFGLHPMPERPAPNFRRLSCYDSTGLSRLLQGRPVIGLTKTEAAIQSAGAVVMYRKYRKPGLGPLGDSLDDMEPRSSLVLTPLGTKGLGNG